MPLGRSSDGHVDHKTTLKRPPSLSPVATQPELPAPTTETPTERPNVVDKPRPEPDPDALAVAQPLAVA
ncbi:hypothetical protein AB0F88_26785 [Streptosporangium sp. NPDC023963]|uniref:hypothetical protein n=1 Tax=Streptosporangium sp. NPDC023963 TaxID=3155608 RepID=UPI0034365A5E